jgi:UDP-N-acetyl-D-mannosaminuronic acid dehydrogenase
MKSISEVNIPNDFKDKDICIIGLGFVGLTLACAMARHGFNVSGIEKNEKLLKMLECGAPHFFEPGLAKCVKDVISEERLKVFNAIPEHIKAKVYIVTVGTPLYAGSGKVNLESITQVAEEISRNLKDGDLVILRSTVKLRTTRNIIKPILDKSGKEYQLAFCPERTIEGQAMEELLHLPQIIGPDSLQTGLRVAQIFQFITPTVVRVSDFETAEMIKLVDNCKRDVLFGYANEVASICNVMGIHADEVISSGRFGYSRTNLPQPGPVGGPCLSKDAHILMQSIEEYGVEPIITSAARRVNEMLPHEAIRFLQNKLSSMGFSSKDNFKIALLGLAFKGRPATDDIRDTTSLVVYKELKNCYPNADFFGFDYVVKPDTIKGLGLYPCDRIEDAFEGSRLVLILNNHEEFSKLDIEDVSKTIANPSIIYDFWATFTLGTFILPENVEYIVYGGHR